MPALSSTSKLIMKLIMFIYLKTTSMKTNWKKFIRFILRIIELIISGGAGGATMQLF